MIDANSSDDATTPEADFGTRDYRASDAEEVRQVFRAAVLETGLAAYTPEQVQAWAARADDAAAFAAQRDAGWVRVAFDDDGIIGFGQIDMPGHVAMLFTHPRASRRGVARALLDDLVMLAEAMGARSVTVDASRVARPFFARHGFGEISSEVVTLGDQALERFRMEATIGSPARKK
ncbi:GNAT family N-acetyltransferase [Uliginosibacterium sp. sgz301328]